MSMFIPLVIMALAGVAWAAEAPPKQGMPDAPVAAPVNSGLGGYLQGAVADVGGYPDEALKGYIAALTDDPENLDLRQRAFELALLADDVPTAVRLARTLPEVRQTTMTRLVQVAALARAGKVSEARKVVRGVAAVAPELLQFRLLQAYLDYANGTKVPDLVQWLQAVPLPEGLEGRRAYHVARLWLKDGQPEKALDVLEVAHKAEPHAVASTLLLGQVLARQGQPDKGAAVFDEFRAQTPALALLMPEGKTLMQGDIPAFASTLDEDLSATLLDFGLLVWAQGAMSPARQVLNLALWLNPDDAYARYYDGMLLEMGGDLAAAGRQYGRLTGNAEPVTVRIAAEIRLAEVKFKQGDTDSPWRTMTRLAKQYPDVPQVRRSVGQLAFSRGEFQRSADEYAALLKMLPEQTPKNARAELLFARGAALERADKVEEATADLQEALKLDPTNAQILNYLGYMWVARGMNVEAAFKLLQKAYLLAPGDGAIADSLGWAYYVRGDYATAMTYLVRAAELEPESSEIADHLGDAYARLDRMEDARREWNRALELVGRGDEPPAPGFEKTVRRKLR